MHMDSQERVQFKLLHLANLFVVLKLDPCEFYGVEVRCDVSIGFPLRTLFQLNEAVIG